jgi:hypothetical protein
MFDCADDESELFLLALFCLLMLIGVGKFFCLTYMAFVENKILRIDWMARFLLTWLGQ